MSVDSANQKGWRVICGRIYCPKHVHQVVTTSGMFPPTTYLIGEVMWIQNDGIFFCHTEDCRRCTDKLVH